MIIAALSQLIMQLVANMTVIALPIISIDLNIPSEYTLWINLLYLMSFVAFSLPFAKIISQYGVRKSTVISLISLFISVLLSFFALNDIMFYAARLLQGLTSASLAVSIYVMIVEEFSDEELGSALGLVASAGYVGMLIAPSFMGFCIYLFDWRTAFLVLVPILLILIILLNRIESEWATEKKPVDNIGSLLYVVMMILFTYGITELDIHGIFYVIAGLIILLLFIRYEKRHIEPIFNLKLFKNVPFFIGNYAAMVTYFSTTIAITILTFHLLYIIEFEEYIVGMILIIAPIIMIGMSNIGGRISNRYDPRLVSGVAMIFLFASMIMFAFMDRLQFEFILMACAFQGIGNGLFSAPNNKFVLTLVNENELADASSILSTSKEFGKILSAGIYSLILSIYIHGQNFGSDEMDGLLILTSNYMMLICAILAFSAAVLLFYSKYRYGYSANEGIVNIFKSITPKRIRRKNK